MRWSLVLLVACSSSSSSVKPAAYDEPPRSGSAMSAGAALEVTNEEVTFKADKRTLYGTLTIPAGPGPWPGILLLAGSGPTDRDWNSALIPTKNGSGALLANALASHGAVVMRFDKAGSGKNQGPPLSEWTLETYRDEAYGALAVLRGRDNVRDDRVFVIGHSEGGIHATRLAVAGQLRGVVYLASASRTMADTILSQLEAQLKNPNAQLSEKAVEQEMTGLRQAFKDFLAGKPVDPMKASRIPQLQELVKGLVNPATAGLTRELLAFDNAVEAPKVSGPFFVSAGGKDVQVDPELDAKRLEKALRDAGKDVTFHLSPDADHVLKHEPKTMEQLRADPVSVQNAYNAEGRVLDKDLVDALVSWLALRSQ
jgi:pimeloyl-ACP methyl ester carboxylesterase